MPVISLQAWRHPATLEQQYFDVEIRQRVGLLVALGDPNDYVPPGGAAREYFSDEQWIAEFREFALSCRFSDPTGRKVGELAERTEHAARAELGRQVVHRYGAGSPLAHSAEIMVHLFRAADVATVFAIDHGGGADGLRVSGRGAVVSFESEGAVVVTQGATSPGEYVEAILGRMDEFK